jgi:hypothetical protein
LDEGIGDTFVSVGVTKGVHASVSINASGALQGVAHPGVMECRQERIVMEKRLGLVVNALSG